MSTLAQLEDRVEQTLFDTANAIWPVAAIDEAIRQALHEYSNALPRHMEALIVAPAAGREIALAGITDLLAVTDVIWPYDSDSDEEWPHNYLRGWSLQWDDAQPLLVLTEIIGAQPQRDDELRIYYTKLHTIQNLDSAAATTLPAHHESLIVTGAAGYAALSRSVERAEEFNLDEKLPDRLKAWGLDRIQDFRAKLEKFSAAQRISYGHPFGAGWRTDKWDLP